MSDKKNMYEGLFLFPQAANLQDSVDHLNELLGRMGAELKSLCKWDERRLAFEIKGNKRGIYMLTYFYADPTRLTDFERDCNLSESLLRSMITRAEHVPAEVIEAAEGRDRLAEEIKTRGAETTTGARSAAVVTTITDEAAAAPAAAKTPAEAAAAAPADAPAEAPAEAPSEPAAAGATEESG